MHLQINQLSVSKLINYLVVVVSLQNIGYEIKDSILNAGRKIESNLINTGDIIKDKIVNSLTDFSNKMKSDIIETGSLIKDQLAPLADGLKSMFDNMFSSFLTSFQAKQQEQDNNLLIYLPIIGLSITALYIVNKK